MLTSLLQTGQVSIHMSLRHITPPAGAAYLVHVLRENGSAATSAKRAQGKLSRGGPQARSELPGLVSNWSLLIG